MEITQRPRISTTIGRKINLGNSPKKFIRDTGYESLNISVTISIDNYDEGRVSQIINVIANETYPFEKKVFEVLDLPQKITTKELLTGHE
jgi:hypothetical protein